MMGLEIERKFLVKYTPWHEQTSHSKLFQGYLTDGSNHSIRVRADDSANQAWITIKGPRWISSRMEWEYEIPWRDSADLRLLCTSFVSKTRWHITYQNQNWAVDEFHGANQGLILAELELEYDAEVFVPPPWLDQEVTTDDRYYNQNLAKNPWKSWAN